MNITLIQDDSKSLWNLLEQENTPFSYLILLPPLSLLPSLSHGSLYILIYGERAFQKNWPVEDSVP